MTTKKPFRISAKRFFLTYPKCNTPKATVLKRCQELKNYDCCVIAKELHEDGEPHLHVILIFSKQTEARNDNYFDSLTGKHGSYESVKHLGRAYTYVTKDNDYISDNFSLERLNSRAKSAAKDVWNAVADASDVKSGLAVLLDQAPEQYFKYGGSVKSMLEFKHGTPLPKYIPDPSLVCNYRITDAMQQWVKDYFEPTILNRRKCLILVGATQLGKTAWARSLHSAHIFMRGTYNLDKWHPDAKYVILDDIDWKFLPNKKQLLCAMGEVDLTDKYRGKKTIHNDKPAIFLANTMPAFAEEQEYWTANSVIVEVTEPLYHPPDVCTQTQEVPEVLVADSDGEWDDEDIIND